MQPYWTLDILAGSSQKHALQGGGLYMNNSVGRPSPCLRDSQHIKDPV